MSFTQCKRSLPDSLKQESSLSNYRVVHKIFLLNPFSDRRDCMFVRVQMSKFCMIYEDFLKYTFLRIRIFYCLKVLFVIFSDESLTTERVIVKFIRKFFFLISKQLLLKLIDVIQKYLSDVIISYKRL